MKKGSKQRTIYSLIFPESPGCAADFSSMASSPALLQTQFYAKFLTSVNLGNMRVFFCLFFFCVFFCFFGFMFEVNKELFVFYHLKVQCVKKITESHSQVPIYLLNMPFIDGCINNVVQPHICLIKVKYKMKGLLHGCAITGKNKALTLCLNMGWTRIPVLISFLKYPVFAFVHVNITSRFQKR